jgi:hypothetical protein
MTFQRLAILLIFAAASASADTEVSTPRLVRRAPGQVKAALGSSGSDFLAAWVDQQPKARILAERIAANGDVLDPEPRSITDAYVDNVEVVWTGATYLIAWEAGSRTWMRTFSSDGVLGPKLPLHTTRATFVKLATSSSGTIAVARGDSSIVITPVGPNGGTTESVIYTPMFEGPFITPFGEDFLIAWTAGQHNGVPQGVHSAIVSAAGTVVSPERLVSTDAWALSVAAIGERALVLYKKPSTTEPYDYYANSTYLLGRFITRTEVSEPLVIAATATPSIADADIAKHRGHFIVSWTLKTGELPRISVEFPPIPFYDIVTTEVSEAGETGLTKTHVSPDSSDEFPVLASNDNEVLLCWIERSILRNTYRLSGAQLDPLLNARRIEIARSAPMQAVPRIAAARDVALVTWIEDPENSGATTMFARRVSASGRLIDATPIRLAESAARYSEPLIASGEREFAITWSDDGLQSLLRRVSRDGTLPDPRPIELKILAFAIASDGDQFAFLRFENGAPALSFLDRAGQLHHAPPAAIDQGGGFYGGTALAWDGSRYLAVWPRLVSIDDVQRQKVAAIWFDRNGRALTGALPLGGTSKVEDESYPTAACLSGSCVVAWSASPELRAVQISASGAVKMIPNRCCNLGQPHVTASANNFLMTWYTAVDGLLGVQAVSMDTTGDPLPATQLLLRDTLSANAALTPDGTLLLTYATTVKGAAYGDVPRVFIRSSSSTDRRRAVRH